MIRIGSSLVVALFLFFCFSITGNAQYTVIERPAEWEKLVFGGRFMDRFLPIPVTGRLTSDTWGAANVIPRYVDNGIEDDEWSYWGGNILTGEDGRYHMYVCRWREDSPKGHMEWPNSIVVHAISDNSMGPFEVNNIIGRGHNPEAYRLSDDRIVIYVIGGYYISDNLHGPWEYNEFEFDPRDRPIIEGLSNLSFTQREDGSFVMVCRGGGIWISKDGVSTWNQITGKSVYPEVEGRFEDPVIWRTGVQYHLIVNDWYGRIAYYLRSKDGVSWTVDPGEAYLPGIAVYEDGTNEDWFKYERIKMLQDELGRPEQANFAVIDTLKHEDQPNDKHSSKNIGIPLVKERLIQITGKKRITGNTKSIQIKVFAEEGFDPHTDIDFTSLRLGAPLPVNYGGGSKVTKTRRSGKDVVLTFEGPAHEISEENFTAKIMGKTTHGGLFFGYARLPGVNYREAVLSARLPVLVKDELGQKLIVEVENFGQVKSGKGTIRIDLNLAGQKVEPVTGNVPALEAYQGILLELPVDYDYVLNEDVSVTVTLNSADNRTEILRGQLKSR